MGALIQEELMPFYIELLMEVTTLKNIHIIIANWGDGFARESQFDCWLDNLVSNGYRFICSISVITFHFGSL